MLRETNNKYKEELFESLVQNRNICERNRDILTMINSQLIHLKYLFAKIQMLPESDLAKRPDIFEIHFQDRDKSLEYYKWMGILEEKYLDLENYKLDLSNVWKVSSRPEENEDSRSGVGSSISLDSES